MTAVIAEEDINRIRWHCRRGMLELDMVLARFLEEHADRLTAPQWQEFERLVSLEDHALWQRITATSVTDSTVERLLRGCIIC
ncbi:succinate dehydrogenase assembly factor 2 [Halothiobacillus sp.]|uniref:FAD assembly factor SdhE n=1 Tax=Halothiobacillus sp. TaxID=1891311 RepID=UPI00261AC643|nr:succinate dehydrogenase assembly factor 2 [Halothiobacillus sp.]